MFRGGTGAQAETNKKLIVAGLLTALIAGLLAVPSSAATTGSALAPIDDPACKRSTNTNGNVVLDMDSCMATNYIPDVAGADAQSQAIAFGMFKKMMRFCADYSNGTKLRAGGWNPITEDVDYAHWHNDSVQAAPYPSADFLVENSNKPHGAVSMGFTGKTIQLMWQDYNLPYLGTIVHAHNHGGLDWEMLHVNCKTTIEEMYEFTLYPATVPEDPSAFETALQKAETEGIAGVSSQIAATGGSKIASGTTSAGPSTDTNRKSTVKSRSKANSGPVVAPWARSTSTNSLPARSVAPKKASNSGPVKIMPLGDSLTHGPYRVTLEEDLKAAGASFDLVGTQKATYGNDVDHEGYQGICAANCPNNWNLSDRIGTSMAQTNPDIILLHIGTNDLSHVGTGQNALANLDTLLAAIYQADPQVQVLLAENVVRSDKADPARLDYNALMPGLVNKYTQAGNSIALVKMGNLLTAGELSDTVHPTAEGYIKMGHAWFDALKPYA